jgi:hypothetical protein
MNASAWLRTLRALSLSASVGIISLFVAILAIASRTVAPYYDAAPGVEVILLPRENPAPPASTLPSHAPGSGGSLSSTDDVESADRASLAQMLACLRPRELRPPWCASEQSEGSEAPQAELPVGGDFYQTPRNNRNRIYSPAELATIVMPPCEVGCVRVGRPPPPPSRSAEQICEDGNLGGPCHPPPLREEEIVRQRHSD